MITKEMLEHYQTIIDEQFEKVKENRKHENMSKYILKKIFKEIYVEESLSRYNDEEFNILSPILNICYRRDNIKMSEFKSAWVRYSTTKKYGKYGWFTNSTLYETRLLEAKGDKTMEEEINVINCAWCDRAIDENDAHYVDGEDCHVCNSCWEDVCSCEECEQDFHTDDLTFVVDNRSTGEGHNVCRSCLERFYVRCDNCGEYVRRSDAIRDNNGDYFHESCYDEWYTTCDDCGEEVSRDAIIWDEERGMDVCGDCYRRYNNRLIHGWHDDNIEYHTNATASEKAFEDVDSLFLIGIEHEVSGSKEYARGFLEIVNGPKYDEGERDYEKNVMLCNDSSIDNEGFEIVSQAMTLKYYEQEFLPRYEKGLRYLDNNGFRGKRANCGIHIHFTAIKDRYQLARLANILYGNVDDRNAWYAIADRTESNMKTYASMSNRRSTSIDIIERGNKEIISDRYTALNYDDRTGTHELRIFNSTMSITEFKANIEILLSLLDFTSSNRVQPRGINVTTYDWVSFISQNADRYKLVHQRLLDEKVFQLYSIPASKPGSIIDFVEDMVDFDSIDDIDERLDREAAELTAEVEYGFPIDSEPVPNIDDELDRELEESIMEYTTTRADHLDDGYIEIPDITEDDIDESPVVETTEPNVRNEIDESFYQTVGRMIDRILFGRRTNDDTADEEVAVG